MKLPKNMKRYCRFCKKHTEHKYAQAKKKERGSLKWGSVLRARKRGQNRGVGNHGKYSRGALSSWKRYGAKTSKKYDLRFECGQCKKSSVQTGGVRAKKWEFT